MPHEAPAALETLEANYLDTLDESGTYTPVLTAATTNPNLGASGEALGWWQRNGHLITGGIRLLFSGSGLNAGSGVYQITLPFPADLSLLNASSQVGTGSQIGSGFLRDDSMTSNNRYVQVQLSTSTQVRLPLGGGNASLTEVLPIAWATGDRISLSFSYAADAAGLP